MKNLMLKVSIEYIPPEIKAHILKFTLMIIAWMFLSYNSEKEDRDP